MKSESELKVNDELIAKYLSGDATPEEAMILHDWLEIDGNKTQFDQLRVTWEATNPGKKIRRPDKDGAWRKIGAAKDRERSMIPVTRSIAIAASILIAAVAALLYFRSGPASDTSVVTTLDSTKNITLPDNSRITMYRNTALVIPNEFDKREVTLVKGEAFFSIEENEAKPFVVRAGFANIRVVGTEFNVVMNDNEVIVGVSEGKVLFYSGADSILVEKGTAASLRPHTPPQTVSMNSNTWAYATRMLVFKDTPMSDVIGAVEKTYGRRIRVSNDNVKKCKLTATFDDDSVENIVLLIAETLNLKLEQNGQAYILDGEGCP